MPDRRRELVTRGRELLNRKLRPHGPFSQQWLADVLGVGQSCISLWSRGLGRPDPHIRDALFVLWRIPAKAWLLPEEVRVIARVRAFVRRASTPETPAQAAA